MTDFDTTGSPDDTWTSAILTHLAASPTAQLTADELRDLLSANPPTPVLDTMVATELADVCNGWYIITEFGRRELARRCNAAATYDPPAMFTAGPPEPDSGTAQYPLLTVAGVGVFTYTREDGTVHVSLDYNTDSTVRDLIAALAEADNDYDDTSGGVIYLEPTAVAA